MKDAAIIPKKVPAVSEGSTPSQLASENASVFVAAKAGDAKQSIEKNMPRQAHKNALEKTVVLLASKDTGAYADGFVK